MEISGFILGRTTGTSRILPEFIFSQTHRPQVLSLLKSTLNPSALVDLWICAQSTYFEGLPTENPLRTLLRLENSLPESIEFHQSKDPGQDDTLRALEKIYNNLSERRTRTHEEDMTPPSELGSGCARVVSTACVDDYCSQVLGNKAIWCIGAWCQRDVHFGCFHACLSYSAPRIAVYIEILLREFQADTCRRYIFLL